MKNLYGLEKDTCHALIALFRIESLKQDIAKQAPTEVVTQLALQFFGIGINTGLGSKHITGPLKKRLEKYCRTATPANKSRGKSSFTIVMEYLCKLCQANGKNELLIPGNIDGFMKFAKGLADDTPKQDPEVAGRISRVVVGDSGFFEMQVGHGKKSKTKKVSEELKYYRATIQDKLSKLRPKGSAPIK